MLIGYHYKLLAWAAPQRQRRPRHDSNDTDNDDCGNDEHDKDGHNDDCGGDDEDEDEDDDKTAANNRQRNHESNDDIGEEIAEP